jgi:predicted DNA-binding protein (MmcQ/YjbR family)
MARAHDDVLKAIRAFGLAYPGAHYKSPWPDHLDLAVDDKTFAYLSVDGQPFGIACKLRHTAMAALELPFTRPAGYGLGKSGWVDARFAEIPVGLIERWIDESYRAQALKRRIRELDASGHGPAR